MRLPRIWSNGELKKFAHLFQGSVINVSAWLDRDKEGAYYKNYFAHAKSYTISNWKTEAKGFHGMENEIFLDLEKELNEELIGKFDIVFNHTTLEHIYDFHTAFKNLCKLSKDLVIVVVPFLQMYHTNYGDYWRFSPDAIARLFQEEGMHLQYLSFNNHPKTSVYIFAIGTWKPEAWNSQIPSFIMKKAPKQLMDIYKESNIGSRAIQNSFFFNFYHYLKRRK